MQAFRSLKAEMRDNAIEVTSLVMGREEAPARIRRGPAFDTYRDSPERHPYIDPWMEDAFHHLAHASEDGAPFALVPCSMNGKPAAVIAAVQQRGSSLHVMPLFLACQPWMKFGAVSEDEEGPE